MYRMLFEELDNPQREEILNVIADCIDDLSDQGFDDKDVIECTVKYALTLASVSYTHLTLPTKRIV